MTHLPQVASYARHHWTIRKLCRGKRTITQIQLLKKANGSKNWPVCCAANARQDDPERSRGHAGSGACAVGEEQNSAVFPGMDNRGMIGRCEFRSTPRLGERHLILGGGSLTGPCPRDHALFVGHFHSAPRQPSRRRLMTVRIVVAGRADQPCAGRLRKKLEWSGAAWEARRRRHAIDQTEERRAKQFRKRFKAREATLLAKQAGEQPVESLKEAKERFWQRTGKL